MKLTDTFSKSIYSIIILCIIMVTQVRADRISQNDSTDEKSELRVGINFNSDYYFMGRSDSAKAPYLSPFVGYYHKSGLSLRSSFSYLASSEDRRIDLFTISGGYNYYGKKVAAGFSVSEYFFSSDSYSVQSEMNTYLNGYVGYDFDVFMIYADASLGFSNGTDVFLGAEINRTFYALRNHLRIIPAVYINAGTQSYYNEYYALRSTQTGSGKNGKGMSGQNASANQVLQISESAKFELLDYEAELQVNYKIGRTLFFISSTWTFPVNPATIISDEGSYEEKIKNGFYWSSGVRLTFN